MSDGLKIKVDSFITDSRLNSCTATNCIYNYNYDCDFKNINIRSSGICNKFKKKETKEIGINTLNKKQYLKHWIQNLVSTKTRYNASFKEWIKGFEDRYTKDELDYMRNCWLAKSGKE